MRWPSTLRLIRTATARAVTALDRRVACQTLLHLLASAVVQLLRSGFLPGLAVGTVNDGICEIELVRPVLERMGRGDQVIFLEQLLDQVRSRQVV